MKKRNPMRETKAFLNGLAGNRKMRLVQSQFTFTDSIDQRLIRELNITATEVIVTHRLRPDGDSCRQLAHTFMNGYRAAGGSAEWDYLSKSIVLTTGVSTPEGETVDYDAILQRAERRWVHLRDSLPYEVRERPARPRSANTSDDRPKPIVPIALPVSPPPPIPFPAAAAVLATYSGPEEDRAAG